MSRTRPFGDTTSVDMTKLLARSYGNQVKRTDALVNRTLSVLLAVAIGAGLAWWLWEWASACTSALTCGLAMVRPAQATAQTVNEERLHAAVDAAFKNGKAEGYQAGFTAGARYGRVLHIGAGVLLGALLVAGLLNLGLQAGGGA